MEKKCLSKKRKLPSNNIEISKKLKINIPRLTNPPYQKSNKSPKIISFYAEKGGVGKTTMCITLAHVFAAKGKRVLIYDCDVQRSLTAWLLGNNFEVYRNDHQNEQNPFDNFLNNKVRFNSNIFARSLAEQVEADGEIKPAYAIELKKNLYLVQGSRDLISVDERIAKEESFCVAMTNMGMTGRRNDYTGKLYHSIMKTAQSFNIDFVFLDMNPYPGNINRCLIMCSNYFIIPVCLDYFCQEMLFQMRRNITLWDRKISSINQFTNYPNALYPWPNHKPKLIGFIPNMFSNTRELNFEEIDEVEDANWINRSTPHRLKFLKMNNEEFWLEKIQEQANKLTREFSKLAGKFSFSETDYQKLRLSNRLGEVPEFYDLGNISNIVHIPIPFLEKDNYFRRSREDSELYLISESNVIKKYNKQKKVFRMIFIQIVNNILKLIDYDTRANSQA